MNHFIQRNHRILFYLTWFIINIIQAVTTELFDDEAYYWIYSQFPAWGYFDHPPMIAFLIKAGGFIFSGELGVRLLVVLLNTGSLFLIEKLLNRKDPYLFYAICLSIAVAQIGGMIAVPDLPLLFFVSLFFLAYKRYVNHLSIANTVLLGVTIALMLYSKYHGVLIVLLTLLSNIKLFARYQTYIVAAVSLTLFTPHLYWQYLHDFPSVQFHLFERNAKNFNISYTLEYILGQLLLAGPIMGWLFIWSSYKHSPDSATERALKFSLFGLYIFFLISTLKGRVEANWTAPAFVALIVLSHQYLITKPLLTKWVYRALPVTVALVLIARIFMIWNMPPAKWLSKDEFHGNKVWVNEVKKYAGNLPVVILNSYQRPSKYWFYSGNPAMALNTPAYRRNNFNYWPIEDSFINKRVYVLGTYDTVYFHTPFKSRTLDGYGGRVIENYYSFSKLKLVNVKTRYLDNKVSISFTARTTDYYLTYFQKQPFDTASIYVAFTNEKLKVRYIPTGLKISQIKSSEQQMDFIFSSNLKPGKYSAKLAISTCIPRQASLNSTSFNITIP